MTPFKAALGMCGLSRREAAAYLDVSESSVDKWSRGVQPTPEGVWHELAQLWAAIDDRKEQFAGVDTSAQVAALNGLKLKGRS